MATREILANNKPKISPLSTQGENKKWIENCISSRIRSYYQEFSYWMLLADNALTSWAQDQSNQSPKGQTLMSWRAKMETHTSEEAGIRKERRTGTNTFKNVCFHTSKKCPNYILKSKNHHGVGQNLAAGHHCDTSWTGPKIPVWPIFVSYLPWMVCLTVYTSAGFWWPFPHWNFTSLLLEPQNQCFTIPALLGSESLSPSRRWPHD